MPLVQFNIVKGKSKEDIQQLLDLSHEVFVKSLNLPPGDRFQTVSEYEEHTLVMKDVDLGFTRDSERILVSVVSRPRPKEQKVALYKELVEAYETHLGIKPENVMINFVINDDEDWSFGFGRAQFLTGELS